MSRIATVLLLLMPLSAMAAGYVTYAQWAAMSPNLRAVYIAGSIDTLVTLAANDEGAKYGRHYELCLQNAKMNNVQLAENILKFASTRPTLQTSSVQKAMIEYLIDACGKPAP
jgi:hypothetical protein